MGLRFNPPPEWPLPAGFVPPAGWQPDPTWRPAPLGWQLWLNDDTVADGTLGVGTVGDGIISGPTVAAAPTGAGAYPTGAYPPGAAPTGAYPAAAYPHQVYQQFVVPQGRGVNGFAVAGFVFSLIGGVLLSAIFSAVGLVQVRRSGQRGKGLAVAGLVLTAVWIVIIGAVIAISAASSVHRSAGGTITGSGKTDILSLRVGDCFQNPTVGQATVKVGQVTAVPCTTPHNAQVFAQFNATDATYPGAQALSAEAVKGCRARVATGVDKSKITATMTLHFVYPQASAWTEGKRTIRCLVVDSTKDLTSSLLPAGH